MSILFHKDGGHGAAASNYQYNSYADGQYQQASEGWKGVQEVAQEQPGAYPAVSENHRQDYNEEQSEESGHEQ